MVAIRRSFCPKKSHPIWDKRDWADYVRECVRFYRSRSLSTALNHHDWDDITQLCLIHVWKKRKLYQKNRPLKPWLKVVTLNQIQNQIRNRLCHCDKGAALYRWYLRTPKSLVTRTVYVDSMREEVKYEPDAIDPRTLRHEIGMEDLGHLKREEKMALHLLMKYETPAKAARYLNGGKRIKARSTKQQSLYKQRKKLQQIYEKALNG